MERRENQACLGSQTTNKGKHFVLLASKAMIKDSRVVASPRKFILSRNCFSPKLFFSKI